jgi:hypothetical protein
VTTGDSYGSEDRRNFQTILDSSPDSLGWLCSGLGAVVFAYFYRQAKRGIYERWRLWLAIAVPGIILFAYGLEVLVERSFERV